MYSDLLRSFKTALIFLITLSVIVGVIYPLFVIAVGQLFFPWQANGSMIKQDNRVVGSALIGQWFNDPRYFWGRPSATTTSPYNSSSSSGSNLGPSNPQLLVNIKARINLLKQYDANNTMLIPVDLVTTSGSGLDPDISPNAAFYQVTRIASQRGISQDDVERLVYNMMQMRQFSIFGEPRVNVLQLNMALDNLNVNSNRSAP